MSAHWIQTWSGKRFDLLEPDPDSVRIADIARALANLCRYTGHSSTFYSVAQHSVLVSFHVPEHLALPALLHDAAEAYVNDLAKPLKDAMRSILASFEDEFVTYVPNPYDVIEARVATAISSAFGVSIEDMESDAVKRADLAALVTEKRDLMGVEPEDWTPTMVGPRFSGFDKPEAFAKPIYPLSPDLACDAFLARYLDLA